MIGGGWNCLTGSMRGGGRRGSKAGIVTRGGSGGGIVAWLLRRCRGILLLNHDHNH